MQTCKWATCQLQPCSPCPYCTHTHTHLLCTRWTCGSFALARVCNQPAANWITRHSIGPLCPGLLIQTLNPVKPRPTTNKSVFVACRGCKESRISNLSSFPWYLVLEKLILALYQTCQHERYNLSSKTASMILVQLSGHRGVRCPLFLRTDIDSSLATRAQSCWACSRLAAVYITGSFFSLRRVCVILESSFHCPLEQEPDHAASHSSPSLRVAMSVTASTEIHWWEQHHLSDATTQESILMRSSRLPFWVALMLSVELARHCSCRCHRLLWYWVICTMYYVLYISWAVWVLSIYRYRVSDRY
jgi:hypothetical protein